MSNSTFSAATVAALACASLAHGQVAAPPPPQLPTAPIAPNVTVRIPEGTSVGIRFEDMITSKTAHAGDEFAISTYEPIDLGNGMVIPAGAKGIGEVMTAERHGFIGKAGQLNVQVDYVKIGDKRLHLRATKGGEGKGSLGSAVALTVLFGPLGLLARGADITIPAGQKINAYVQSDTDVLVTPTTVVVVAPVAPGAPTPAVVATPAPAAMVTKASAPTT